MHTTMVFIEELYLLWLYLLCQVPEGPNKVFIGGLPYHLTASNVRQMLEPFGPMSSFNLIKARPPLT